MRWGAPQASITANRDVGAHTNVVRNALAFRSPVVWCRLVDIEKSPPYTPLPAIYGPPKTSQKTSLTANITVRNSLWDPGAHTNVVRNAFTLPLAAVWSRLVDIEFWPKMALHTRQYGPQKRLKNVFNGQNNGRKRIFRCWSPYKCC